LANSAVRQRVWGASRWTARWSAARLLARCTRAPRFNISPSEQNLPVQVCPPPLQEPAAPFPVRPALAVMGRGRPALAVTINKAQGKTLQRMGVCLPCSVFSRGQLYVAASGFGAQDHINFAVPNGHGDGLEGVYTEKHGVLGVDQVSTSVLCSAVLLCSVTELLLWCVHCTCTIAKVQVQVALLFLCSAPLSPLPGSVSHDSTHLTAHPLKSQLPEPVMHIGRHAAGQQARAVLTRMRVCCRLKGRASAGGPARSLAAAVLKRWQHHLSCQGRGGGPAGPWTTRAGTVHMHFHQAR